MYGGSLYLYLESLIVAGWFTLALFKESFIIMCVFSYLFIGCCSRTCGG
jgi:hypothetical protein